MCLLVSIKLHNILHDKDTIVNDLLFSERQLEQVKLSTVIGPSVRGWR